MTNASHLGAIYRRLELFHPRTLDFPQFRNQRCTSPTARGQGVLVRHSLWLRLQSAGRDKIRGPPAGVLSKLTCGRRRLRHGKLPARLRHSDRHEPSGRVDVGGCGGRRVHGHRRWLRRVTSTVTIQAQSSKITGSRSRGQGHHRLNLRPSAIVLSRYPFHFQTSNTKHVTTILLGILLYEVNPSFAQSPFVSQF